MSVLADCVLIQGLDHCWVSASADQEEVLSESCFDRFFLMVNRFKGTDPILPGQ